jgi:hypothetical protein
MARWFRRVRSKVDGRLVHALVQGPRSYGVPVHGLGPPRVYSVMLVHAPVHVAAGLTSCRLRPASGSAPASRCGSRFRRSRATLGVGRDGSRCGASLRVRPSRRARRRRSRCLVASSAPGTRWADAPASRRPSHSVAVSGPHRMRDRRNRCDRGGKRQVRQGPPAEALVDVSIAIRAAALAAQLGRPVRPFANECVFASDRTAHA